MRIFAGERNDRSATRLAALGAYRCSQRAINDFPIFSRSQIFRKRESMESGENDRGEEWRSVADSDSNVANV